MRPWIAPALIAALALGPAGCRQEPEGAVKVVVIGSAPRLADPALGPVSASDAVLVQNVAQGLVSFDAAGNIVPGLAERWNVSDDGMSYIFRIAAAQWDDGHKITAQQVARILKRAIGARSKDTLKDSLGAVSDVVAMTDRVVEIQLLAPRPNLLALFAQPEMGIVRGGQGTGPFTVAPGETGGALKLTRTITSSDDETSRKDEVLLAGAPVAEAVRGFALAKSDVVLGGTFTDLLYARRVRLPRGSLRFDPAAGLLGLVPLRSGSSLDKPEVRRVLSEAIDRDTFIAALSVPGLSARATLLEPGLDGMPVPAAPSWTGTPLGERLPGIQREAARLFGKDKPTVRVTLPTGPGADLMLQLLIRDWGALGLKVERAASPASADFLLIDEVAPSSSPAWYVRRFRCEVTPVCDPSADVLMDAARQTQIPPQRYALLGQAAARIDDQQLFIPIAAPVRWSLVSERIQNFAGNRYARHTLSDLEQKPGGE